MSYAITFNHQKLQLEGCCSLTEFVESHLPKEEAFALILNEHFIPRSQYATTYLKEGDRLETILPMQGG